MSFDILPVLEIALSASPSPATIEFWDADAVRKLPVALYEPIHAFPDVLPFHNNMTCSADDNPTPNTVSAFLRIGSYTLFSLPLRHLLSYISFSGFANDAPLVISAYLMSSLRICSFTLS